MLVICVGPWVIRKTKIWAIKVIGRGVVNDVFENGRFKGNLYWKYRKNGQNQTFRRLANFIAYPLGADTRDILAQFWGVKNFVLGLGWSEKGSKMAIFGHFQVRIVSFHTLDTIDSDFGAKMDFYPGWGIVGTI